MIRVTDEQVLSTLRDVVRERPDNVYKVPEHMTKGRGHHPCYYVHIQEDGDNPEPGCVVGAVLARLGVPLERMADLEGGTARHVVPRVISGISDTTTELLHAVQQKQDQDFAWGMAYSMVTGEQS
jgi:hypothetical protein